jgi:hypothetical protein
MVVGAAAPAAAIEEQRHSRSGDDLVVETYPIPPGTLIPQAAITIDYDDAYDGDPMGIVAYRPFTTALTSGVESWDVWICRTTTPPVLAMSDVVAYLNTDVADYFTYLSEGRYTPSFRPGAESSDAACGVEMTHSGTTPRIYVFDYSQLSPAGQGGPGLLGDTGSALVYEGEQRRIEVTIDAVTATSTYEYSPAASIVAHEMGHSIFWAHSGSLGDYDNPLDLMSGGWGGVHGFDLYSAGWIEPTQVALHHGGDRTYTLGPVGYAGSRMVVLDTNTEGVVYVLSARPSDDPILDANSGSVVGTKGLEVYRIDQTPTACFGLPAASPCLGPYAAVTPYPANPPPLDTYVYDYFHETGTSFSVEGVTVTVGDGPGETLVVGVNGGLTNHGVFTDDDGSIFEGDNEWISAAGITRGCNPPRNDRYCPADTVTRGQMAAFLVRARNLPASTTDFFTDDDASIFEGDINALAATGIARGCNPPDNDLYCPAGTVTREQMAAFLRRAYDVPDGADDPFTDDDASVFEGDINALAATGIARGCNPPDNDLYCPRGTVSREQMAAFLRRAEG